MVAARDVVTASNHGAIAGWDSGALPGFPGDVDVDLVVHRTLRRQRGTSTWCRCRDRSGGSRRCAAAARLLTSPDSMVPWFSPDTFAFHVDVCDAPVFWW